MPKEGTALSGGLREEAASKTVHPGCVRRRDGIPQLGGTKVEVVDAVQVHVLGVPGEAGPPHAEVEVSRVDTGDVGSVVFCDCVQDGVQVVYVPLTDIRVVQGARDISSVQWRVERDVLPVLTLYLIHACILWRAVALRGSKLLVGGEGHGLLLHVQQLVQACVGKEGRGRGRGRKGTGEGGDEGRKAAPFGSTPFSF